MARPNLSLFGFSIKRNEEKELPSFVEKQDDEGSVLLSTGGAYGQYVDIEGSAKTEAELVTKYRELAKEAEVEYAIDEIVNEAIASDENDVVTINLDNLEGYSENVKKVIREEVDNVKELLDINNISYELFRRWYIDGQIYYHVVIDEKDTSKGIQELRYIDPRKITKVREIRKDKTSANLDVPMKFTKNEYYLFAEKGFGGKGDGSRASEPSTSYDQKGLKIAKDSIIFANSGLMDENNKLVLSYLHKALRPFNQLRSLENSLIIYRLVRAPERRIFYIDVGNMPGAKAEQYLRDMMVKHKNRLVYDAGSGEVRDDRKHMTMLEDYWFPRRNGESTKIETLPGGQNLGDLADLDYFLQKMYKSLNIPVSRLNPSEGFSIGRPSEITRDEIKFQKFITRLRKRFSMLLYSALEKQLVLKNVISEEEWPNIKNNVFFEFAVDNHFSEMKNQDILQSRFALAAEAAQWNGIFVSSEWIKKEIFRQTDEDIEEMEKQIAKGKDEPIFPELIAQPDEPVPPKNK
jgi:hypothetical protein